MANGSVLKYETKSGEKWRIIYDAPPAPDGSRRQRQKRGFDTKREADQALREALGEVDAGTYVERKNLRVGEFFTEHFLPAMRPPKLRESTHALYERDTLNHVIPGLGGIKLQALGPADLSRFYRDLAAGTLPVRERRPEDSRAPSRVPLSRKTVLNVHGLIHAALDWAVEMEMLDRNPADKSAVRPPAPEAHHSEEVMQAWSPAQVRRFLSYLREKDDRLYALWYLFPTTGLRRGEALGLRWEDLDLDNGRLSVRRNLIVIRGDRPYAEVPKTKKSRRTFSIDPDTVGVLREHRHRQVEERLAAGTWRNEDDLMFTYADGRPLHPARFSKWFTTRAEGAGLPVVRLHDLRHTYATIALLAGVPMKVVSERLGHASVSITQDRYSHVLPEMDERAAEDVAAAIFG